MSVGKGQSRVRIILQRCCEDCVGESGELGEGFSVQERGNGIAALEFERKPSRGLSGI